MALSERNAPLTFRPCATAAILSLTPWIWDTRALALAGSGFISCSLMVDDGPGVLWLRWWEKRRRALAPGGVG